MNPPHVKLAHADTSQLLRPALTVISEVLLVQDGKTVETQPYGILQTKTYTAIID